MTKDEALKLALEALHGFIPYLPLNDEVQCGRYDEALTAIKEALAQPEKDNTYVYASSLATAIWHKHYMKDSPKWKPLDTTEGVLTQIDNMTCGLVKEKTVQPEQEPVAFASHGVVNWIADKQFQHEALLYSSPQRTWVGLTDEDISEIVRGTHNTGSFVRAIEAKLKEKNT